MEWEIGLVRWYDGPATEIVTGFTDMNTASKEATRRNEEGKLKMGGHGSPSWMWARKGEITRIKGCLVSEM